MLNFLLNQLYNFLSFLISLLPASEGFPSSVSSAFSSIGGYFAFLDSFIPTSDLLTAVGILFSVEITLFVFKVVRWVVSFIPFIGGKGV